MPAALCSGHQRGLLGWRSRSACSHQRLGTLSRALRCRHYRERRRGRGTAGRRAERSAFGGAKRGRLAANMTMPDQDKRGGLVASGKDGGKPAKPLLPNLNVCGDIGLKIARDGTWYYQGSPIGRQPLVKLFSTVLRREDDGFYLVTPVEKMRITVEDAPFIAVRVDRERDEEGAETLRFVTNVGDEVQAGPEHPIRVQFGPDGEPRPYLHVRRDLWAKVTRALFYDLVELGGVVIEDRQQPDLDRQDQRVRDERVGILVEDVLAGENQRVARQVQRPPVVQHLGLGPRERVRQMEELLGPEWLGGIGPDLRNLMFMKETADRLFLHMKGIRARTISELDRANRSIIDHMHIIEALEARNAELAERLSREHTLNLAAHIEANVVRIGVAGGRNHLRAVRDSRRLDIRRARVGRIDEIRVDPTSHRSGKLIAHDNVRRRRTVADIFHRQHGNRGHLQRFQR